MQEATNLDGLSLETIERDSSEPIALQTYRILSRAFEDVRLPPGSRLPGERQMATRIGVSRETLRKALTSLKEDGLVESSAQRGWFVPDKPLSEPPNVLQSFTAMAADAGFSVSTVVLSHTVRTATLDEANMLKVAPASRILEVCRLRLLNDSAICVDRSRLPAELVKPMLDIDLSDRSLFAVLEETCDITPSRADYEVAAEPAPAELADLLAVDEGAPLLVGYETTYDRLSRPILLGRTSYRGDAYRFTASLFQQ
jgi:GntR family transcriptional regulator